MKNIWERLLLIRPNTRKTLFWDLRKHRVNRNEYFCFTKIQLFIYSGLKIDITQKHFLTYMMHDITFTRPLPNVITCMMQDITRTSSPECYNMHHAWYNMRESSPECCNMHHACYNIRESSRGCHNIRRALVHVISCIMHVK